MQSNTYENPLVTAVITTYKRRPEIVKRALDSIVGQTYNNIEIYIVNDCPTDLQLVRDLRVMINESSKNRMVNYIVVEKNGGACRARNIALEKAQGKYFACLDDDDEWLPDKLELQVAAAENKSNVGIVYCNAYIHTEGKAKEKVRFNQQPIKGNAIVAMAEKNVIGSCSFPLFSTQSLRSVGGFGEDMPALQDWELYLRMLRTYDISYVDKPVARYYFYDGERISAHPERRIVAYEKIREDIEDILKANPKSASSFYLMGTYFYSLVGDTKKAFKYYCMGVKRSPFELKRNCYDFLKMIGRKILKPSRV